jgi:hypothetical protein
MHGPKENRLENRLSDLLHVFVFHTTGLLQVTKCMKKALVLNCPHVGEKGAKRE